MLFNSTLFLIYLPLVVLLYYRLGLTGRRVLLLIASYVFYWVWSVPLSALLLFSTFVDYGAALLVDRLKSKTHKKLALSLSLVTNLGLLALFKYADFFSSSAFSLTGFRPWPELDLLLPLGISFYTFQTISYTIDVYRGVIPAKRSLMDVALYVAFFPQLVAGPIVRSDVLIPQLATMHGVDWERIRRGVGLILWGLVKKVYFADAMAQIVNEAYAAPEGASGFGLLMATYAFAVQIYCDFSGYSDIAIGSALLLGISLPKNFDAPYLACSIREFWRRWHISLSTWLRDYLYIPLGGSRLGTARTYANLMITMVLGGLWHGAGWNWVAWGGLQGVLMSLERALGVGETAPRQWGARIVRWLFTFHLVCASWVLFRVSDIEQAGVVFKRIATMAPGEDYSAMAPLAYLGLLIFAESVRLKARWLGFASEQPTALRWLTYGAIIALVLTFAGATNSEFIYFQF